MLSSQRQKQLKDIEKKLGIFFVNKSLLNQALTHSSYAHEMRKKGVFDNERLEFLGDAVLKLVASEFLFNKYPEKSEGDLTKIRAGVVSDETLMGIAKKFRLGNYLLLGANERRTGGRERKSNLANALEAIIGALYLDAGIGKSRQFILDHVGREVEKVSRAGYIGDYKSALQEFVQKKGWGLPHYHVIREIGPKHRKTFYIEVKIKGSSYGYGKGANKKEAEQRAAERAYRKLKAPRRKQNAISRLIERIRRDKSREQRGRKA